MKIFRILSTAIIIIAFLLLYLLTDEEGRKADLRGAYRHYLEEPRYVNSDYSIVQFKSGKYGIQSKKTGHFLTNRYDTHLEFKDPAQVMINCTFESRNAAIHRHYVIPFGDDILVVKKWGE